jgi:hypothetical protein
MNQDLDYLNGFWADTPDFVFAGDGELHTGHSFIRDSNQAWFAGLAESLYCSMSNGQVHVFGPDAASLATEFEWGVVTLEGDTVRAHGSWMYVFGFVDEDWRVVHSAGTHLYE